MSKSTQSVRDGFLLFVGTACNKGGVFCKTTAVNGSGVVLRPTFGEPFPEDEGGEKPEMRFAPNVGDELVPVGGNELVFARGEDTEPFGDITVPCGDITVPCGDDTPPCGDPIPVGDSELIRAVAAAIAAAMDPEDVRDTLGEFETGDPPSSAVGDGVAETDARACTSMNRPCGAVAALCGVAR